MVSSNGRYLPRNPAAERWLARDERSQAHPIRSFFERLADRQGGEFQARAKLFGRELNLRARPMSSNDAAVEMLVIIEDTTELKKSLTAELEPVILRLNQNLSQFDFSQSSKGGVLMDMARQLRKLEAFCNGDKGASPSLDSR